MEHSVLIFSSSKALAADIHFCLEGAGVFIRDAARLATVKGCLSDCSVALMILDLDGPPAAAASLLESLAAKAGPCADYLLLISEENLLKLDGSIRKIQEAIPTVHLLVKPFSRQLLFDSVTRMVS